jgi:amidophosphoribosyltransferase
MCGVVGAISFNPVNQLLFDALTIIQHRGQDAAGIVTCNNGRLHLRKDNGLVRDVFRTRHMNQLKGKIGIGHVRYPTAGSGGEAESQPFYVNSPYGITLAHNGNLTNVEELKSSLLKTNLRHLNTDSDSEVLLNVFAHELQSRGKLQLSVDDIFVAVKGVHERCRGAYAVVAMITGYGIVAFRDPFGIRPLIYGKRQTEQGSEYLISSESVALDCLGFETIADVQPGEAVFISTTGECHRQQCATKTVNNPCIFEYVYLARPDSIIDGICVYQARLRMGEMLGKRILAECPQHDIDVVIPIPDTSRPVALSLAALLGVNFCEGFVKNRYIGRTFIMPGQVERERSVRQKLNTIELEFKGKNVLLVDDSIVRGTTSEQIVQLARAAGAKKVYFASAAPPVRYPNVYGIDIPASNELVAHQHSIAEISRTIGADWLIYQDLADLKTAVSAGNTTISQFEDSVFSGQYVTGDIDQQYLTKLEQLRSDSAKQRREQSNKHLMLDFPCDSSL